MTRTIAIVVLAAGTAWAVDDLPTLHFREQVFPKPYSAPCVERENVFEFTEKPKVKALGNDKYEITFAVKGNCDVTVGLIDDNPSTGSAGSPQAGSRLREDATAGTAGQGKVVRHLGAGVLGANAPAPFQKNSLRQTIYWNGKDDLDVYHKEPGKLKVRVWLGLKPEFEKRLGVTNPKSIPGRAWGICIDESGGYVFAGGIMGLRKFDHDGNYVRTLFPPPANLPPENRQGLGFVEYEPGLKALHTPDLASVNGRTSAGCLPLGGESPMSCQPAVANGRIYYCTIPAKQVQNPRSLLHYVCADGSTETKGVAGRNFLTTPMARPNFAASPDGRWLYMAGDDESGAYAETMACAVFRCSVDGNEPAAVFAGQMNKPGSDNSHFNRAQGVDCDSQGRVYVCDNLNSRIQVLSPDGKCVKSIPIDRPVQIKIHRKTGAIYVLHTARVQGASLNRISKITSFDNPAVEFYLDCPAGLMALDSWTPKPRIWLAGVVSVTQGDARGVMDGRFAIEGANVRIWEEDGKRFQKIADFAEEIKKEAGATRVGTWSGSTIATSGKMVCDPVRARAYFMNSWVFDLKTGAWLDDLRLPGTIDDLAFDKRGYMHCHFNPGFYQRGVGRLDPSRGLRECPYDYGVDAKGWLGVLPVRDQPGSKFFQDGIGVNMMGDVAENCNIYYAPKMDEEAHGFFRQMTDNSGSPKTYAGFQRVVQEMEKRGEEVYSIRRAPGTPVAGATIWTFDSSGELRDKCAVLTGNLMNGVMIDENGDLYFVNNRTRLIDGKPFLAGRGGIFGAGKDNKTNDPFTGTLIKTGRNGRILSSAAPVPMEEPPKRPADLSQYRESAWCEGAEWFYAGASPIVPGGCSCPTQRLHTDWYKRTFVPEAYRHSIGVVDTAGNLILHIGQYGNFDSGYGPSSKIPVGGDGIAFSDVRMVSGTDNYLCFSDRGERIIVLKLNYHAEETVGIGNQ